MDPCRKAVDPTYCENVGRLHVMTNDIVAKFRGGRVQVLCVNTALLPLSLLEEEGFHEDVPLTVLAKPSKVPERAVFHRGNETMAPIELHSTAR
jgi:hypothetical protein